MPDAFFNRFYNIFITVIIVIVCNMHLAMIFLLIASSEGVSFAPYQVSMLLKPRFL